MEPSISDLLEQLRRDHAPDSTQDFGFGQALKEAPPGETFTLDPGTYFALPEIARAVTIRGDASKKRPTLLGNRESSLLDIRGVGSGEIVLEHLAIRGGGGTYGAISARDTAARLVLRDCVVFDNVMSEFVPSAGAISTNCAHVHLERCLFVGNEGSAGGAVAIRGYARLTAVACLFVGNLGREGGGAVWTEESAHARLVNCTFVGNRTGQAFRGGHLEASGTKGSQPRVELVNCVLGPAEQFCKAFGVASPPYSGTIDVRASIVPETARDYALASFDGSTVLGAPTFAENAFPYAIARGKAGSDDGDPTAFERPEEALDLFGQPLAVRQNAPAPAETPAAAPAAPSPRPGGKKNLRELLAGRDAARQQSSAASLYRVCRGAVAPR